jgi:hypothetical protein
MISTPRTDIRIRIEGQTVQFHNEAEAFAFVGGFQVRVGEAARAVAEARCLLGSALIELSRSFPGHSMDWLCKRCGVNRKTGAAAVEFAQVAADPQTGRLSYAIWEQLQILTREWCEQHGRTLPDDSDTGEYSVPSILVALGKREPTAPKAPKSPEQAGIGQSRPSIPDSGAFGHAGTKAPEQGDAGSFADPFEEAMNNLPAPRSRGPKPEFRPGYVPPAERPAGCVGATQPELPWHLAESARTLADRAAEFERAVERGEVEPAVAHDIQARIDGLLSDIAAAKAVAGGAA